jgi:hypothetical protein
MFKPPRRNYYRSVRYLVGIAGLVLGVAASSATDDRDRLTGAWEGKGEAKTVWTIAVKGDSMQITQTENDHKIAEFECNTLGRECETKQSGKPVKVSMWFNGPKLVVMEVRGSEVLKRRFHATDDGSAMEVELIPIVPQGKPELVHLTRAAASH